MDRHNRTTHCTVCPSPQTEDRLSYTLHAKRDDSRKAQKPPYRPVASAQIPRITPANVRYLCIDVCLWNRLFHRPKVRLTPSLSQGTVTPVLCALGTTQFCSKFPHFVCVLDGTWAIPHLLPLHQSAHINARHIYFLEIIILCFTDTQLFGLPIFAFCNDNISRVLAKFRALIWTLWLQIRFYLTTWSSWLI